MPSNNTETVIDGILARHKLLADYLDQQGELSLSVEAELNFKKYLIIGCGSFFEDQLLTAIGAHAARVANERIANFVRNKGLSRQYHTFFKWDAANINGFLGLFGETFKITVEAKIKADPNLISGMRSFLELGAQRNLLAHGNLVTLPVDLTLSDIIAQYRSAWSFIQFLISLITAEDRLPEQNKSLPGNDFF